MKCITGTAVVSSLLILPLLAAEAPARRDPPGGSEKRLEEIARHVPGFAGFWYGQDKKIHISLVGNAGEAAARSRFGSEITLHPAAYEFGQLKTWRDTVRPALGLPGLISLDLDEVRNRVVFGIDRRSSADDRAALVRAVRDRGVPQEAVLIEDADPIELIVNLQDDIRPQPGGVNIDVTDGVCTLGFNVHFEAGNGFVTASHCTDNQGQVDNDYVGWGQEERDPPFTSGSPCPTGRQCRYSDSALIYYAFVVEQGDDATIARTTQRGGNCPASRVISGTDPRLIVRGTSSGPSYGTTLDKIGRTTGWTTGTVTSTCVDINISSSRTLLCQYGAGLGVQIGDSGSPVFAFDDADGATLYGIIWASSGGWCESAYFSDIDWIDYELGPMTIDTCPGC
jgi:hypothetical protein